MEIGMGRRRRRRRIPGAAARARRCYARPALSALVLGWAGCLNSLASAQSICATARTAPIRVEDSIGLDTLRDEANCTDRGSLEAEWAGAAVTIETPIAIASGTFLTVTGDDALAEAQGGSQTRLFEVSPGGSLTLTQLILSGGAATNGGAIYSNAANLTLDGCSFEGNVATGDGGAVWADGGNVTIVGGEFLNNTAAVSGGAVLATDASLVVKEGARFENNKAAEGGALYCGVARLGLATGSGPSCSIRDAEFVSNNASLETFIDFTDVVRWEDLDGGGAAAFWFTEADITDSVFTDNYAQFTGGAVFGGNDSDIKVHGCNFSSNTAKGYGGAIGASSMTLGADTRLVDNQAVEYHGGAVFGWNLTGAIEFNDMFCRNNSAVGHGGCFYGVGGGLVNNGTVMLDNVAEFGGCIYGNTGCDIEVAGGTFTCQCTKNGAFMFASDGARVHITGGLVENSVATRRAGAVYCSGDSFDEGGSQVTISGGTFRNNSALELGGAVVAWGTPTVVTITGGEFINNTAKFYGGFIFLEEEASLNCTGAVMSGNYAGDQGGGIYAREATWVNSSCDLIANESPQGAAIYLTNVHGATFENHDVAANLASGGSVVYVAASSVIANKVTFESGVGLQEDSSNRAIQLDGDSSLNAGECIFDGWRGDTVVYHRNADAGSLVLDSCDFSGSSATMAVISPKSDAEIRNAVVSSLTFENAVTGTVNSSLMLVDRALDCSASNACGTGDCVNSTLGVLCECLEGGECLDGGGGLSVSLSLTASPKNVTLYPDTVSYELVVSSAESGKTNAIWELDFESSDLVLDVVPSSGVLPPGGNVTVTVTGTPSMEDVGGDLVSSFNVTSVGSASSDSTSTTRGVDLEVTSTFYLCPAYDYADNDLSCVSCATITVAEGVNCEDPGATLASLPIREGYWRSSRDLLNVRECLHEEACVGATEVSSSDDYCEDGYEGPYCAVCMEGYGRGVSNSCHYCDNTKAHLLIAMGTLFSLVVIMLLLLAVVFLIGGLDAIDIVRQTFSRKISFASKASSTFPSGPAPSLQRRFDTEVVSMDATVAPAYAGESAANSGDGEGGVRRGRVFPTDFSESDDDRTFSRPRGAAVGGGAGARPFDSLGRPPRLPAAAGAGVGVGGARLNRGLGVEAGGGRGSGVGDGAGRKAKCCGLGEKIKRLMSKLPLNKLKILVVVWQILAVFSGITGVEFPASYATFLSWISVVNLDIGNIFSASCILPAVNFYLGLLASTLGPLVLTGVLVLTYHMAKKRAGIGSAGVIARRAAWSRHVAAGLLLTFLVFTSASTAVFKTFACDTKAVEGESYLRADYSISCDTDLHMFFEVYSGLMILVYPIGIPVLYAVILWKNRELLNPRIVRCRPDPDSADESVTDSRAVLCTTSKGKTKNTFSQQELEELEERVIARKAHPELAPSMFLWKDFGPDLYYYEVVECGRRMLLTGVLIFIAPQSATQAAMACIFAFASLLGFELLRPHMDPSDSWLYRLGCVIIFLTNFLALLIKVEVGSEDNRAAFGVLLIAVNVLLVLAVLLTTWFAVQQSVDDSRDEDNAFNIAKTMLTAEQDTANHARLARERRSTNSLAPSSARLDSPRRSDSTRSWRQSASFRELQAAAEGTNEDGVPYLARGASISPDTAERLWQQDNARLPVTR